MTNAIVDLWPTDIGVVEDIVSPVMVLKEQATLLGQKTKNLVQGEVRGQRDPRDDTFVHNFYLVAPAMDGYRFLLFTIRHPVELYPLELDSDYLATGYVVDSHDQLLSVLRAVFAEEKTIRMVKAIIAQSQD